MTEWRLTPAEIRALVKVDAVRCPNCSGPLGVVYASGIIDQRLEMADWLNQFQSALVLEVEPAGHCRCPNCLSSLAIRTLEGIPRAPLDPVRLEAIEEVEVWLREQWESAADTESNREAARVAREVLKQAGKGQ